MCIGRRHATSTFNDPNLIASGGEPSSAEYALRESRNAASHFPLVKSLPMPVVLQKIKFKVSFWYLQRFFFEEDAVRCEIASCEVQNKDKTATTEYL